MVHRMSLKELHSTVGDRQEASKHRHLRATDGVQCCKENTAGCRGGAEDPWCGQGRCLGKGTFKQRPD